MNSAQNVHLEVAKTSDLLTLQKVCIEAYNTYFKDHWEGDGHARYLHKEFSTSRLLKDLNDLNIDYYFIMQDANVIGFTKLMYHSPPIDDNHINGGEIVKIYLLGSYAGKGLGSMAMPLMEEIFIHKKKHFVYLKVVDTNAAIRFYQRLGFIKHSRCTLEEPGFKKAFKGMFLMIKKLNN